jgi:PIN domain nuclease of toxin-antitoxin system
MRALLDTHALLWWLVDDERLSGDARGFIGDEDNDVLCSAASAWEIATKHRLGKLPEAGQIARSLPSLLRKARIEVLGIGVEHALKAGELPGPHKDPFDRMLIAQAKIEKLPVITADPVFGEYGVRVLW